MFSRCLVMDGGSDIELFAVLPFPEHESDIYGSEGLLDES